MDFSLLLVVAVAVTGLIWLLDILWWRRVRRDKLARAESEAGTTLDDKTRRKLGKEPWPVDYSRSFFPVLLVVLLLRSFLVEPFQIPSGSMRPTLEIGDFILVNKYTYGLRLPVTHTEIVDFGEPERGDVMVFRFPEEPTINFIKRVIGLPGDRIRYEGKQLYVNGEPVPKQLTDASPAEAPGEQRFQERLAQRVHAVYNNPRDPGPQVREVVVPAGHYFVMGDNRDHSNDSRYWGFVPEENIVGKAFAVWMHWDGGLPSFTSVRGIE
ncbi:signal peptidase I Serine peptidase. MEROPS family S26A [Modicisalibacter ilicicola DSM 19980]|uniref:Signal peptidase I n=1 Tax=Modicisalibacter ilicicola DSM 19980 TaxID=1121942 RepID=A0A1M5D8X8_9GAMM|nr:signal peptidase I [Halomonas ilicicola]SHF63476.1 signal peptidase I Serine peptidase. MEROPS family S26A [Halomonas ilicicola DSM 19980]